MQFIARYFHPTLREYFRSVFADSVNEATKLAERMCNKGYRLVGVVEKR